MFKIGDKARIKPKEFFDNLSNGKYPIIMKNKSIRLEMKKYFDSIVTIYNENNYYNNYFHVKENDWVWADWMLEKISNIDENKNYLLEF